MVHLTVLVLGVFFIDSCWAKSLIISHITGFYVDMEGLSPVTKKSHKIHLIWWAKFWIMSWIIGRVGSHFYSQFSWSLKNNVLGLVVEISCFFRVHKGTFESCHTYTTIYWESILCLSEQDILHVKFSGLSFHQRLSHTKKLPHL